MARGVNHPREDWEEHRGAKHQARKLRVQWAHLRFVEVSEGFYRKLTITHVPTGVSGEAEGYHVGRNELRDRIYPVLVRAVGRYRPDKEPEARISGVSTEVPDEQPETEGAPEDTAEG